jgi:hypothetical protein
VTRSYGQPGEQDAVTGGGQDGLYDDSQQWFRQQPVAADRTAAANTAKATRVSFTVLSYRAG